MKTTLSVGDSKSPKHVELTQSTIDHGIGEITKAEEQVEQQEDDPNRIATAEGVDAEKNTSQPLNPLDEPTNP